MKKNASIKKLNLSKSTVAALSEEKLNVVKGGFSLAHACPSAPPVCNTYVTCNFAVCY